MKKIASTKVIHVCGSGTMGRGIAQFFASKGFKVELKDIDEKNLDQAKIIIEDSWNKLEQKGKISKEDVSLFKNNLSYFPLGKHQNNPDLIIEAIWENMDAKKKLFQELFNQFKDGPIYVSNTSGLSVQEITNFLPQEIKSQFFGMHFFNPATIMKLVELVCSKESCNELIGETKEWLNNLGKIAVITNDSPGFIVNRLARNFYGEALRLVHEDSLQIIQVDDILRLSGFPMGPFSLMDLIGIDINLEVTKTLFLGMKKHPRLAPHPLQEEMVRNGDLGKKSGKGFLYNSYTEQESLEEIKAEEHELSSCYIVCENNVWAKDFLNKKGVKFISPDEVSNSFIEDHFVYDLSISNSDQKIKFLEKIDSMNPRAIISDMTTLPVVNPTQFSNLLGAINSSFYSPSGKIEIFLKEDSLATEMAQDFFYTTGLTGIHCKSEKWVFTLPRIVSMIINEAYFALSENLCLKSDMDLSLKYGVNYPLGPWEWECKMGHYQIKLLLLEMQKIRGKRYELSPALLNN